MIGKYNLQAELIFLTLFYSFLPKPTTPQQIKFKGNFLPFYLQTVQVYRKSVNIDFASFYKKYTNPKNLSVGSEQGMGLNNVGMGGPSILAGIVAPVVGGTKLGLFDWRQNMLFSFCFRKTANKRSDLAPPVFPRLVWAAVNE